MHMKKIFIENCCEILDSMRIPITAENREKGPYPYYGANGIQDYVADYIFNDELVLLAEDGGNFGSKDKPIAYRVSGKCWVNNHAHVLKPKSGLNVDYLCYSLMFYKTDGMVNGATRQKLTQAAMRKMKIPLIPMDEQLNVVHKLNKITKIKEQREKELKLLDDIIRARFVELFECGDHEIVKASDVCDFITKGTTPPTGEITEEYENGKIPFLKVYNLSFTGEMLFDENPQYILAETHNGKLARSKVYPNDVLMNIVGPPLGKFTLVTDEFEEWNINQAIAIFRAKERILPRFLLHALMQPKVLEPFIGQAVGIRQQNLSLEQCRNLQFPLPSLEEQKSFVEFAEQLDKSKVKVQKALDETQKLFDSLMQQYFG